MEAKMAVTKEQVVEFIENMTVIELSNFVKELEEKFGVSAAAVQVAPTLMGGQQTTGDVAEAEEKTAFDVILSNVGDKKVQVIKVVREITGLGLKEAKALVDTAPKPVKEGIKKEEAEQIKAKFEEVGASVEIK
jgi:large subunit ribosomal protein L7/L12